MPQQVGIIHSGTDGRHKGHIDALGISPGDIVGGAPRWADDDPTTLTNHANHLVADPQVKVLVAAGGTASSMAAQTETQKAEPDASKRIPVVFTSRADTTGLEPNVTGICARTSESDVARLELLNNYFLPAGASVGVLYNKSRSIQKVIDRAGLLKLNPVPQPVTTSADIDAAFKYFAGKVDALLVAADPLFNDNRPQVIGGAKVLKKPAIYQWREFADENGLLSYGTNATLAYKLAGTYVRRILGDPANLPQPLTPESFELVINLKTAHSQGIDIPNKLLAQAHDVIV
jgi:putative tryptophan/tyrosine transport system substrate-binding protein